MEKRIYWFLGLLITGMFCVSCSENEDVSVQRRVTEAESSLNLIAPNGVKIISDIAELKKKLSEAVETLQEDEFEIVAIDFFPLVDNYCVKIVYMKSNGKTGSLAISDYEYQSSENLIRMRTRSEDSGSGNV